MKYNRLGTSELMVSEVCLGSMTWGVQNTEQDAHEQIDYARSRGINFIDTAELYPVPGSAHGQVPGTTEKYIGTYLAKHPEARKELIIATKVMGFSNNSKTVAMRKEPADLTPPYPNSRHDSESIKEACEGSLRRLQTDYIDLYQIHWPDRYVPIFGSREYKTKYERDAIPFKEIALTMKELVESGKIRYWGLSNESTFGVCEFVKVCEQCDAPKPVSIQNPFCLLNRQFEAELAEACSPRNYNIGLLPWSILCGGALTGKYQKYLTNDSGKNKGIEDARFVKYPGFQGRFLNHLALEAVAKYEKLAKEKNMSVATLAQAFCKSRWYIPSSIIGATKMDQLKENIDAFEIDLDEKILKRIDDIHNENKDINIAC